MTDARVLRQALFSPRSVSLIGAPGDAAKVNSRPQRVRDPRGEVENPMTDDDLAHKFRANCEPIIGKPRCGGLLERVWDVDRSRNLQAFFDW